MLWFKLECGLLRVRAGKEVRFAKPSATERLRLLWIFRNFSSLPMQVLSPRQRVLMEKLDAESVSVPLSGKFPESSRVIGTIEWPAGASKKPAASERQEKAFKEALPRASGMGDEWAGQSFGDRLRRGVPISAASGATAPIRALAGTVVAASHTIAATSRKTGKILKFSIDARATAYPLRSKFSTLRREIAQRLRSNASPRGLKEFVAQRRLGIGLLIALVSVLAFALTRDSSRPSAPGPAPAPSVQGSGQGFSEPDRLQASSFSGLSPASGLPNGRAGETTAEQTTKHTAPAGSAAGGHSADWEASMPKAPARARPLAPPSSPSELGIAPTPSESQQVAFATPPALTIQEPASPLQRLQQGPHSGILFPSYPEAAWKSGKRGRVTLRARVALAGVVSKIEVLSGDPVLAQAATQALQRWRYEKQSAPAEVVVHFDFINPEAISVEFEP